MIKTLAYVVLILIGLCLSPFVMNNTGYIHIAISDYQIETSVVIGAVTLVCLYFLLRLAEWLVGLIFNIVIRSRILPELWRRKAAKKHTLLGALALAEEDWPTAEKAMAKGAAQGELPLVNLFSAARAAQHQQKHDVRDAYLAQAEQDPSALTAVNTSRVRYLLQQGDLTKARAVLNKLEPTSKSKTPVLQLALDLYLAQQDWQALKLLLPIISKRRMLTETVFDAISLQTNSELLNTAMADSEAELEKCWQWLSKSDRNILSLQITYAKGLRIYNKHADALKLLSKTLKASPSSELLDILPDIITAQDDDIRKLLARMEQSHENDASYQICLAKLALQLRDAKQAKLHWQNACRLQPSQSNWFALAQVQEQLGENATALQSYRNGASCND